MLAALYKYTNMRTLFGIIMLALVEWRAARAAAAPPASRYLSSIGWSWSQRRSEYDLLRARERAHILEGLVKALDIIDRIIKLIRTSSDTDAARKGLISDLRFSDLQAQAILEMPLRRLTQLDRKKLEDELAEKRKIIKFLEDLLKNPIKILGVIKDELLVAQGALWRRPAHVDSDQ